MKHLYIISLFIVAFTVQGQVKSNETAQIQKYEQEISVLKREIYQQKSEIQTQEKTLHKLVKKAREQEKLLDSLKMLLRVNEKNLQIFSKELGTKIEQSEAITKDSILRLDKDVNQNRIYWLLGSVLTLVLGGIVYWLLGKRIKNNKTDIESQIKETQKSLGEEAIKLDSKLVEVLETQLKLKQEEKIQANVSNVDADHSLALKIADEIIRIQKNISQMDANIKGLKQLTASVKRIQDNFAANGYELVEMIGKEYNEGMKVVANFIPSEDLETGKQIITRIIKPQVNYRGIMIQAAQVEISVGQ